MMLRLHRIALGIGTHIVEFRRWNTQVQHQHAIDSAQHGGFLFLQSGRLGAFGSKVAELEGVLFQFQRDEISHTGGILAAVRLRHGRFGHKAVFGNDVRHSGECAAVETAERLRIEIERNCFEEIGSITVSFGVSEFESIDEGEDLLKKADEALYLAKRNGRNRVEVFI
jgi:hypothetical protein